MRPLFYPDDDYHKKFNLSMSNFKVYHETYLNPLHPYCSLYNSAGLNIFDYAMIVERTTGKTIKENEKITPGYSSGFEEK